MLIHEYLELNAQKNPEKIALIFENHRKTYSDIDEDANRIAQFLVQAGVKKGDRVSIFLENSIEAVVSIYAVLKAGGVFLPLSATLKTKKLEYILNNSESTILITETSKLNVVSEAVLNNINLTDIIVCGKDHEHDKINFKNGALHRWEDLLKKIPGIKPVLNIIDIDLAYIIYTSGSTGDPKGVMMTHLSTRSAATSIITYLKNTESDIVLNVLPLSFDYGLYQLLMAFMYGGTQVLEKSFAFPFVVIKKIMQEKVTGFPIVPTILAILLQLNLKKYDLSSLRYISNTGAALPVNNIRSLRELLSHIQIYSMYGLTECKRVSYLPPEDIDRKPSSVGKGMPNEEVYIVDDNGNRVGPGVPGELVIRGSNVMRGYWKAPELSEKILKPGLYPGEKVLHSGDLFTMDEEGYLYFISRKDDLIKTRGERVGPREVENALHEIEGVVEAAVIGVPDEILGSAIKAFIAKKPDSNLSEVDVITYCMENLETFMVPKYVVFVDNFAKTSSGKIDKKVLQV